MSNPKPIINQNSESIESVRNNLITYHDKLALEVSSYYYIGYIEGTNKKKHRTDLLCETYHEYYLELIRMMPSEIGFTHTDLPLFYRIDLKYINKQITKIMGQSRVKREPYDKKFLVGDAIYYNEETSFVLLSDKSFLNLETMDVKAAF